MMKKVVVTMGMLLSLGLFWACSSDDNDKENLPDSMETAYDMIYGQWQEIYHYDGKEGKNLTDGPVVSFVRDNSFRSSTNPDKAHSFKILKIHKQIKDTLYCLVFHDGVNEQYRAEHFQYQIEGDVLHVREEFFGTDFNELTWEFKKCK